MFKPYPRQSGNNSAKAHIVASYARKDEGMDVVSKPIGKTTDDIDEHETNDGQRSEGGEYDKLSPHREQRVMRTQDRIYRALVN